jgi:hypothetical protein
MGFRFRRSWGVLPGVRLNLGLKSGSVSFGVRGLHYTVGTKGQRVTAGLPDTGLYWTQKINSQPGAMQSARAGQAPGYLAPGRPGSPQVGGPNQAAQLPAPHIRQGPQVTQPTQLGTQPPIAAQFTQRSQPPTQPIIAGGSAGHAAPARHSGVFVPIWLVWGVLAVIAITGLCFAAATVGQHLR